MAGPEPRSPKARDKEVSRDDAIRADPSLLRKYKQAYEDWYAQPGNAEKAMQGSKEGWDAADAALDAMIARKKTRSERRYPAKFPANDNGEE